MSSNEAYFEEHTGSTFLHDLGKFKEKEHMSLHYEFLNQFVDTSDTASMGVIRVADTDVYPTKEKEKAFKKPSEKVLKDIKDIASGFRAIPPIIVEKAVIPSQVDAEGKPAKGGSIRKGYRVLHGVPLIGAYEFLGWEYIPAIVYDTPSKGQARKYDNSLTMDEFLGVDFERLYELARNNDTTATQDESTTFGLLSGGQVFKDHPEYILGEPYQTTNAFNREVTRIKGTKQEVVSGIQAETLPDVSELTDNVLQSITKPSLVKLLEDETAQANVRKVLNKDQKLAPIKQSEDELLSFDEVVSTYNDNLSEDEIKAWIWYKRKQGEFIHESVILNKENGWSKYVIPISEESEALENWLKAGVVCYANGEFIPSVLYYSENIYDREASLLRDHETIISRFNEEQYKRQLEGLEQVKPAKLTLTDPVVENRLVIKPISDFAQEISVTGLADGTLFQKMNRITGNYEPTFKPLPAAFVHWLREIPKEDFERSNAYEIENYYMNNKSPGRRYDKEERLRMKQNAKEEGDLLFGRFLAEAVMPEDQSRIELDWNSRYNGYVPVNYFKIPVGFSCSSTFKNKPLFIRPAQREGIGFLAVNGSGCIAYDVGVGKTMTGILSIAQAMENGMCKRPLIIVPNQTYKNWLAEIRGQIGKKGKVELTGVLPQYPVNDFFNLGEDYLRQLRDENGEIQPVPEFSISVITYEGLRRLGFGEDTWDNNKHELYNILDQGTNQSARQKTAMQNRIETMMGKGLAGGLVDIEELGFDFLLIDEAHALKKIFTSVKGEMNSTTGKRASSRYQITSGTPSSIALKGFMLCHYILHKNQYRNVVLLTATPFTNNPLEIYSMLALIGYHQMKRFHINNLQSFFNHFIKTNIMLTINAKMKPERKEVVMGFNNLIALQKLIFRFIDYKSGEDANIQRPNKWVLPLTHKTVGDEVIPLPREEQISTNLPLTEEQRSMMAQLEQYITGTLSFEDFCLNPSGLEEESEDESNSGEELDESRLSDDEMEGARVLRGITLGRQIAFSPYLFSCHRFDPENLNYKTYVKSSPKLTYVMGCIASVKDYHEQRNEDMSGQVIYTNAGISYFPLIKEYLIKELGFDDQEVVFIKGGMSTRQKEISKDKFQAGKAKVLLGSKTIMEGINLQNRATVLYNLWLDWNPTDLKQLEGRIWRFGNQFANVRIVLPLMEDSIDTAIFQKLEEKTSRINEIWHQAGKENSLKLEDFNPAELKMGLITNPKVLAEITLMEEREIMQDEITRLENQIDELKEIAKARSDFREHIGYLENKVEEYKPLKEGQSARKTETVFTIFREYLNDEEQRISYMDNVRFDTARKASNLLKRATERILEPRGLDINFYEEEIVSKIKEEIKEVAGRMKDKTGSEAIDQLTREIIKERQASGYQPQPVEKRVIEFARLNEELLSEKMVYVMSDEEKAQQDLRIQENEALEDTDALLVEMEQLLQDTEEMELLMKEMEELLKAA